MKKIIPKVLPQKLSTLKKKQKAICFYLKIYSTHDHDRRTRHVLLQNQWHLVPSNISQKDLQLKRTTSL